MSTVERLELNFSEITLSCIENYFTLVRLKRIEIINLDARSSDKKGIRIIASSIKFSSRKHRACCVGISTLEDFIRVLFMRYISRTKIGAENYILC